MRSSSERRRSQRIHLDSPLAAKLATLRAVVTDITDVGAKLEHDAPLPPGKSMPLELSCNGEKVTLSCEIIRSKLEKRSHGAVYVSGIRFASPEDPALETLHDMITRLVERDLEARQEHLKIRK